MKKKATNKRPRASRKHAQAPVRNRSASVNAEVPASADESQGGGVTALASPFNNVLTASRMTMTMACLRKSFWAYEVGLSRAETFLALRVGSAWATAMEARWRGSEYEEALAIAVPEGIDLDAYTVETVAALLAGYYDHYGVHETAAKIHPEVPFSHEIGNGFTAQGVMDGLGTRTDGMPVLVESKTTADSLDEDSEFWQRLRFNMQIYQYVVAAREEGWDIGEVLYDVTRKPTIRPKTVQDLDSKNRKIVLDANGQRVFLLAGKNKGEPRQGGDVAKGYFVKEHVESPREFSDRLWMDATARPEFYFARREVPILEDQVQAFLRQRDAIGSLIRHLRSKETPRNKNDGRDPEAWPRNVSKDTCNFCQFKSFCLSNIAVDINNPPAGFAVKPFNQEVEKHYEQHASSENATETT